MKTPLFTIILLIAFSNTANSQSNKVFSVREIIWFGLDYSESYFINNKAFPDPYTLKNRLFLDWNNLVFTEKVKYNIAKSFNKRDVIFKTSYINIRNSKVDIFNRIIDNNYHQRLFNPDSIQQIINSYEYVNNMDGIGLVFIVESLNKLNHEAVYWVTFFDIKTKKLLLTEQIIGVPSGAGLHNYWANSYYNALRSAGRDMGFIF